MSDWSGHVDVDGTRRTYACHRPDDLASAKPPLLVALHGRRLTIAEWRRLSRFDAIADRRGFVVVYPEGYELTWNDGRGGTPAARAGIDDVGFVRQLIDHVVDEAGADPERVAVAGLMAGDLAEVTPTHAVSTLLIHGTRDPYVPMSGGRSGRGRLISVVLRPAGDGGFDQPPLRRRRRAMARHRRVRSIQPGPSTPATQHDPTTIDRLESSAGAGGTAVSQWTVNGGGHTWPGGPRLPTLGRTTRHFDAGEVIWDFVSAHFQPADPRRLPVS